MKNNQVDNLQIRAQKIGLWGVAHSWDTFKNEPWITSLIEHEEVCRRERSLERRMKHAKLGKFKPFADFDWNWPKIIDRPLIENLFTLSFLDSAANVVIVGSGSCGKTMLAKNLAHQAIIEGSSALFISATQLISDLASQDTPWSLERRLQYYAKPTLLIIDEIGYVSVSAKYADLLFDLINKRYENSSTIVTASIPFNAWAGIFQNASCASALVDRLIHSCVIINIVADSYRLRESAARQKQLLPNLVDKAS